METLSYLRIITTVALIIFTVGIYRNLIKKILSILEAQKPQKNSHSPKATSFLKLLLEEVVLQQRIRQRSDMLWIRHLMIFGGFALFFVIEFSIGVMKNFPSFRVIMPSLYGGLVLSGIVLLLGLFVALVHWLIFRKTERALIDVKSIGILLVVVLSGFMSVSCRQFLDSEGLFAASHSLAGLLTEVARFVSCPIEDIHEWLFLFHITVAAGFIAYIPFSKLIHVLALPIGRVATMDKGYVARKRVQIGENLFDY